MEDDLNFFEKGRQPQFFLNGRQPQLFSNGRLPQHLIKCKMTSIQNTTYENNLKQLNLKQWLWHRSG